MSIVENKKLAVGIVDDSDIIRERIVQRISKCDKLEIVWEADTVEKTYGCCASFEPSVLILDIQLPDGSGIDILERIKTDNPGVKVIMLTNYPSLPFRKKCVAAGADYFFDKSTEFDKVFEVLKQMASSVN